MSNRDSLHELIHSLSKSEKRYFRLQCFGSNATYLKLFDAILAQSNYDESAIKQHFTGATFTKQLHVTKNYLRSLILKTLRNYHHEISPDARIKDILRNIEILYRKELFDLCQSEVHRAENLATKYELATSMVEVQNWKRKLHQTLFPFDLPFFENTLAEQKRYLQILENTHAYWSLAVEINSRSNSFQHADTPRLLKDTKNALSLEALVLHHNAAYLHNIFNNRRGQARQHLSQLIRELESKPEQLKEEPGLYTSTINNLLSFLVFNHDYDEAHQLIAKAKDIYQKWNITSDNKIILKQILRTYNIELELYRQQKEFQIDELRLLKTEEFVEENILKMPKEYLISFWFQFASIRFSQRNFDRSLHWINTILNSRFKNQRQDLTAQIHLLNLMVHFEQNNLFVLRYFIDSTRRYLKKIKTIQTFEKVILRFFTIIIRKPDSEYRNAFVELRELLFPSGKAPIVSDAALDYIDYRSWIDWHIK